MQFEPDPLSPASYRFYGAAAMASWHHPMTAAQKINKCLGDMLALCTISTTQTKL
jgi:hypothetical protein